MTKIALRRGPQTAREMSTNPPTCRFAPFWRAANCASISKVSAASLARAFGVPNQRMHLVYKRLSAGANPPKQSRLNPTLALFIFELSELAFDHDALGLIGLEHSFYLVILGLGFQDDLLAFASRGR